MKNIFLIVLLVSIISCNSDRQRFFSLHNTNGKSTSVEIATKFSNDTVLSLQLKTAINGCSISGSVKLKNSNSQVKVILVDDKEYEYLVYESNFLVNKDSVQIIDNHADETGLLSSTQPLQLKLIIRDAEFDFKDLTYFRSEKSEAEKIQVVLNKTNKEQHDSIKLNSIKEYITKHKLQWKAGHTSLSRMTHHERTSFLGDVVFPPGLEYYSGGVYQTQLNLPKSHASNMVSNWDWRNRHGKNWVTPIRQQGSCGSCWIFGNVAVTEALTNLYFNDTLNIDLSEQNVLSCTKIPWGGCKFGIPKIALNYLVDHGTVDENSYPYVGRIENCNTPANPKEHIKIRGFKHFSTLQPDVETKLKKTIIEHGPVGQCVFFSPKLKDQVHVMTNLGWKLDSDGHTIWIFKSSWGTDWGEAGYMYSKLVFPIQTGFIYYQELPIQSLIVNREVKCTDNDGDGFYYWGIGDKPSNCPPCPDQPDCDDNDATVGPMDEFGKCQTIDEI